MTATKNQHLQCKDEIQLIVAETFSLADCSLKHVNISYEKSILSMILIRHNYVYDNRP